jgi:hypothetical protein
MQTIPSRMFESNWICMPRRRRYDVSSCVELPSTNVGTGELDGEPARDRTAIAALATLDRRIRGRKQTSGNA